MNRRDALRMMAVGGGGLLAGGLSVLGLSQRSRGWWILTSEPLGDLRRLGKAAGLATLDSMRVQVSDVSPSPQDLTLLDDGILADPILSQGVCSEIRELALSLRGRPSPGAYLVTVERPVRRNDSVAEFTVDGRVVEQVDLRRSYDRIEVAGVQGMTSFQLRDGRLTVTESSCRHKLCKSLARTHSGNIVCAPNRLIVRLPHAPGAVSAVTG